MGKRIIIIDAEPIVRDTIASIMECDGYERTQTDNPNVVVDLIKDDPPALIITNVSLPGISGHEAMKLFKEWSPQTPVLMVPGVPESDVMTEWMDKAGFSIFPKPFMAADLRAKVKEILNNSARLGAAKPASTNDGD